MDNCRNIIQFIPLPLGTLSDGTWRTLKSKSGRYSSSCGIWQSQRQVSAEAHRAVMLTSPEMPLSLPHSCTPDWFVLLFHCFLILVLLWKHFTLFFILGIDSMVFFLTYGDNPFMLTSCLLKVFLLFPGYSLMCVPLPSYQVFENHK